MRESTMVQSIDTIPYYNNMMQSIDTIPYYNNMMQSIDTIPYYNNMMQSIDTIPYYNNMMQSIDTIRKCGSGGYKEDKMPIQLKELTKFYKEHYQPLMVKDDVIYYDKLSYILAYEAIDMITNINNNIQEHFIDHLNKYVNINFDIKSKRDKITKGNKDKLIRKELHKNLTDEFKKVKNDLISFTAGTILNDTIFIKKNNLNTHYKNLGISANVNLASRNINTSEPSRNGNEFNLPLLFF